MFASLMKLLGLAHATPLQLMFIGFIVVAIALLFGMLIDATGARSSFGAYLNGALIVAMMLAGLAAFHHFVRPLHLNGALLVGCVALASGISGFLALAYSKARLDRSF